MKKSMTKKASTASMMKKGGMKSLPKAKTGAMNNPNPQSDFQVTKVPSSRGVMVGVNSGATVQKMPGSRGVMTNVNPKATVSPLKYGGMMKKGGMKKMGKKK